MVVVTIAVSELTQLGCVPAPKGETCSPSRSDGECAHEYHHVGNACTGPADDGLCQADPAACAADAGRFHCDGYSLGDGFAYCTCKRK